MPNVGLFFLVILFVICYFGAGIDLYQRLLEKNMWHADYPAIDSLVKILFILTWPISVILIGVYGLWRYLKELRRELKELLSDRRS